MFMLLHYSLYIYLNYAKLKTWTIFIQKFYFIKLNKTAQVKLKYGFEMGEKISIYLASYLKFAYIFKNKYLFIKLPITTVDDNIKFLIFYDTFLKEVFYHRNDILKIESAFAIIIFN